MNLRIPLAAAVALWALVFALGFLLGCGGDPFHGPPEWEEAPHLDAISGRQTSTSGGKNGSVGTGSGGAGIDAGGPSSVGSGGSGGGRDADGVASSSSGVFASASSSVGSGGSGGAGGSVGGIASITSDSSSTTGAGGSGGSGGATDAGGSGPSSIPLCGFANALFRCCDPTDVGCGSGKYCCVMP